MNDPGDGARLDRGMIDSHFHSLEMAVKGLDAAATLEWCFAHGLEWAVDVSVSTDDFAARRALTARFPRVRWTAGIYPSQARLLEVDPPAAHAQLAELARQLDEKRVVAVGEIGLDAVRDHAPLALQQELFRAQLAIASDKGLPVVVHNRDTDTLVYEAVKSARLERGGVMHCFSSDYAVAARFLDLGFIVSFAGNLTFRSSTALQETARRLPNGSFLVETDAPYLSPAPRRGRPNHPGYIGHTYAFLAALRNQTVEELVASVSASFTKMFRIGAGG